MNDQRTAEWLGVDAPFGEASDDDEEGAARRAPGERFAGSGAPSAARPVTITIPGWRRLPAALGLERQEARVLDLVLAMGRRMRRRPLATLAIGAAAGFVIGGALSFRVGRILLGAGARHVARELLKQLL
jgi:hypothetical protein